MNEKISYSEPEYIYTVILEKTYNADYLFYINILNQALSNNVKLSVTHDEIG